MMPPQPALEHREAISVLSALHLGYEVTHPEIAAVGPAGGAGERHTAGRNAGVLMQMDQLPLDARAFVTAHFGHRVASVSPRAVPHVWQSRKAVSGGRWSMALSASGSTTRASWVAR